MASSVNYSGVSPSTLSRGEDPAGDSGLPTELERELEHHFAHGELLRQAMTHRSLLHESGEGAEPILDNERLEFLGDAVLGLVTAESLYRRYPELPEGSLTRIRAALVSRRHLAKVAQGLDLGRYLLVSRELERTGGRTKAQLLANAMEAVIGAVYLDGGLVAAERLIERCVLSPSVDALRGQIEGGGKIGDFKSALQEYLQARKMGQPQYRTVEESGPDHRKHFVVEARAGGAVLGEGAGNSRKEAEQDAARRAMEKFEAEGDEQ